MENLPQKPKKWVKFDEISCTLSLYRDKAYLYKIFGFRSFLRPNYGMTLENTYGQYEAGPQTFWPKTTCRMENIGYSSKQVF